MIEQVISFIQINIPRARWRPVNKRARGLYKKEVIKIFFNLLYIYSIITVHCLQDVTTAIITKQVPEQHYPVTKTQHIPITEQHSPVT